MYCALSGQGLSNAYFDCPDGAIGRITADGTHRRSFKTLYDFLRAQFGSIISRTRSCYEALRPCPIGRPQGAKSTG